MEATLNDDTIRQLVIAGAYALASVCLLAGSMFVAYAARIFRKWKTQDE